MQATEPSRLRSAGKAALIAVPLGLFVLVVILALWTLRENYFVTVPPIQYATMVWGIVSGVIALVPIAAAAGRISRAAITGRSSEPKPISIDGLILSAVTAVRKPLRKPAISIATTVVLAAAAAAILFVPEPAKPLPSSSSMLAVSHGSDKFIYVADPENGQVRVYQSGNLREPLRPIPIGSQGNQAGKGRPESMIELRRGDLHLIFVSDTATNTVHIIDVKSNTPVGAGLKIDSSPRSLAITPDHRKLFVTNDSPGLATGGRRGGRTGAGSIGSISTVRIKAILRLLQIGGLCRHTAAGHACSRGAV
jgi:hypothetical protein